MSFFEMLRAQPSWFIAYCGLLGLLVGSFFNVVIYRLPKMWERGWREECEAYLRSLDQSGAPQHAESSTDGAGVTGSQGDASAVIGKAERFDLVYPPSTCPHCQHRIRAHENIPIISYLFLRGRCASCKSPISLRYPIVEAMCGLLTAACAWHFGFTPAAGGAIVFCWTIFVLSWIDFDTQLLPDALTLPLVWAGLLWNLYAVYVPLPDAVVGAMVGYLSLWSVYWVFKWVTGKEGMGFGDFKLLAALGAWLGWKMVPFVIFGSALVGSVIGITLIVARGRDRQLPMPFGPFLAISGLIMFFCGDHVLAWWTSPMG